eukprot:scaffold9223_cov72-Skeletonema_dohrnii-CCMP3373.AAC.4
MQDFVSCLSILAQNVQSCWHKAQPIPAQATHNDTITNTTLPDANDPLLRQSLVTSYFHHLDCCYLGVLILYLHRHVH